MSMKLLKKFKMTDDESLGFGLTLSKVVTQFLFGDFSEADLETQQNNENDDEEFFSPGIQFGIHSRSYEVVKLSLEFINLY